MTGATVCRRCGKHIPRDDAAWINNLPFCHPAMSTGDTCYMRAEQLISELRGNPVLDALANAPRTGVAHVGECGPEIIVRPPA